MSGSIDENFIIDPRIRSNEILMKSLISCSKCQDFERSFELYQLVGSDQVESKENLGLLCEDCKDEISKSNAIKCSLVKDSNYSKIYFFYYLPKELELFSFANDSISLIRPTYQDLQLLFFKLLKEVSPYLVPDRIKKLKTKSSKDLLKSCRWLDQVISGLFCSIHKNIRAYCVSPSLKGLCPDCASTQPVILISNIQNGISSITQLIKNYSKQLSPAHLNKFIIKALQIDKSFNLSNTASLNLLILEGRDLLKGHKYPFARCVICFSEANFGSHKLINIECGHVICFKCLIIDCNEYCSIDKEKIVQADLSYYKYKSMSKYRCHYGHLLDCNKKVMKLPCFHYSCIEHQEIGACLVCGFDTSLWPWGIRESLRIQNLHKFNEVVCLAHNKKIKFLKLDPFRLFCEMCIGEEGVFSVEGQEPWIWNVIEQKVEKAVQDLDKLNQFLYCSELLKSVSYFHVLSLNQKYKIYAILNAIREKGIEVNTKNFTFSKTLYPQFVWSSKVNKLEEGAKVVLKFSVKTDFWVKGFITAGCYFPYFEIGNPYFTPPLQIIHKIYNRDKKGMEIMIYEKTFENFFMSDLSSLENLSLNGEDFLNKSKLCEFDVPILLSSERNIHEFIFTLRNGFYYYSKPFNKIILPNIEWMNISKRNYLPLDIINGNRSSPILGISYISLPELLKTKSKDQ